MAGNTPLVAAIGQAVKQDAELAEKARALAHNAIDIAQKYLNTGSPKMQLDVIKSIMPAIGRAMVDKGESEEIAELRTAVAEMMAALSGEPHVA